MRLSSRFFLCYEAPQAKTSPARRWRFLLVVLDLEPENKVIFNGARGGAAVFFSPIRGLLGKRAISAMNPHIINTVLVPASQILFQINILLLLRFVSF